jgi:SAM-dependent methyltransferase
MELALAGEDPMTNRMLSEAESLRGHLVGSILDVGCYTGFLYHWLGKPKGYVGVDVWSEAIDVAHEFAPEADFRVQDAAKMTESFDVIWCSQVLWERSIGIRKAVEILRKLTKKLIVVARNDEAVYLGAPQQGVNDMNVFIYED